MEFNYDLFEEARKQCTDVTLEMIQVQNEANKVKGCPLPEGFNGEYLSALVNEVIKLKTDSIAIQKNLNQWAAAVDEAYRAQCGEEYNDVLLETDSLQRQIDEQAAYLGQLGNSRCTDMDLWNSEQKKLYDLNQEKEELNDRKDELAGILGIETEEDQKWYDVLQDATDSLITDCKSLATDYGEMFKSIGTDAFTDNFTTVVDNTRLLGAKLDATKDQIGSDILRGVGNVTENILDFSAQIGSWLVYNTGLTGSILSVDQLLGGHMKEKLEDWTQSIISKDVVDGIYNDYYTKTEQGKLTNEYSYIKYDDALAEGINKGTQALIETAAVIALSTVATPAAGALLSATFVGASEGGKAVNKAYDNGATYDEATLYSALVGASYFATTYLGSKYVSNIIGKSSDAIPASNFFNALKSTFKSKDAISRIAVETTSSAYIPVMDSVAEWLTWGSDDHTVSDFAEIWEKNDTTQSALINAGLGLFFSTAGETFGSLSAGKKLRAKFAEEYGEYGLDMNRFNKCFDNVIYASDGEFEKLLGEKCGGTLGFCGTLRDGSKQVVLRINMPYSDAYKIETLYHELEHSIGGVWRGPLYYMDKISGNYDYNGAGFDEALTDLLAKRHSGKPSVAYNQLAIEQLNTIEKIIDPSLSTLKEVYYTGGKAPMLDSIENYLRDKGFPAGDIPDAAADVLRRIEQGLSVALDVNNSGGSKVFGTETLQEVIDDLNSL